MNIFLTQMMKFYLMHIKLFRFEAGTSAVFVLFTFVEIGKQENYQEILYKISGIENRVIRNATCRFLGSLGAFKLSVSMKQSKKMLHSPSTLVLVMLGVVSALSKKTIWSMFITMKWLQSTLKGMIQKSEKSEIGK